MKFRNERWKLQERLAYWSYFWVLLAVARQRQCGGLVSSFCSKLPTRTALPAKFPCNQPNCCPSRSGRRKLRTNIYRDRLTKNKSWLAVPAKKLNTVTMYLVSWTCYTKNLLHKDTIALLQYNCKLKVCFSLSEFRLFYQILQCTDIMHT